MKKPFSLYLIPFALTLVLASQTAYAQYADYYYHRIGDTIEQDSPVFRHAWWEWLTFRANGDDAIVGISPYGSDFGNVQLMYNFTPDTMKIIGIGGIGHYFPNQPQMVGNLYLYTYDSGNFVQKAVVARQPDDTHRFVNIDGNGWWPGQSYPGLFYDDYKACCNNLPWERTFPVFEYYLDTPVYVIDSFYLGATSQSVKAAKHGMVHTSCEAPYTYDCLFPSHLYKCYAGNSTWIYSDWDIAFLIWPIIQIDTTMPPDFVCIPLENLTLSGIDTFAVTLSWNPLPQYTSVEICYGSDSSTIDCRTIASDTNATTLLLPDSAISNYFIFARAICDSLKHNSAWSDTLRVSLPRAPLPCPPPDSLTVSALDTFAATLSWCPPTDAAALELALLHNGTTTYDTLPPTTDSLTLHLTNTANALYAVTLRTLCDTSRHLLPDSPWSDTLHFTLPRDTANAAIHHASPTPSILLHPNPTTGLLTLTLPETCLGSTLQLLDLEGRPLLELRIQHPTLQIDLSPHPSGTYLLRACGTTRRIVKK